MPDAHSVRIFKSNHQGQRVFSYAGDIVFRSDGVTIARCLWTMPKTVDLGPFALTQGDIFMEYYYAREWFNIFAVYDAEGRIKGWYCNITEPAEVRDGEICWHDWALDLLVLPDGTQMVLDRDEFEALAPTTDIRGQVEAGLSRLRRWAREERFPFAYARTLP